MVTVEDTFYLYGNSFVMIEVFIAKTTNFVRATKSSSPTPNSGATSLHFIGDILEQAQITTVKIFSLAFKRTDIIPISNKTFYYNKISAGKSKSKKRLRIQLLLDDNIWSTGYDTLKNDRYSNSSSDWTEVSANFTIENYGLKPIYDGIQTILADMCFSKL